MDFYNDALKEAKNQNIELSEECKEIFLTISLQIQNLSDKEKVEYLRKVLGDMECSNES